MWNLRLLVLVCLFVGIRELGIAWTTLTQLDLYRATHAAGSPELRIAINAAFGVTFVALGLGFWWQQQWAYRVLPVLLILLAFFDFVWLAVYARADYDRHRLAFVGVTSVIGVGFILWLRRRLCTFIGEKV